MKRALVSVMALVLMAGCDGLNSSYKPNNGAGGGETPNIGPEKPKMCAFDFAKTCWAESAAQITSCIPQSQSEETFSQTKEFCTNTENKLVAFANPETMFTVPMDPNNTPIDFRVFPDSVNECLRVQGTPQRFTVTLSGSKKSMEFDFTGNTMKFTCLDGQTVQVPYEAFEGCAQSMGEKYVTTVPGMQMLLTQKGNKARWNFRLRGAPNAPDFFKCVEP